MIVTITMSRPPLPEDGRTRRRIEAMRRVQDAALDLFEDHGFGAVTVEQIAERAGVGVATVYRGFGTKERTVLWDEYDPEWLAAASERLRDVPPLEAIREALGASLERVYQRDRQRILRRARLILSEPALRAASATNNEELRGALSRMFREGRACEGEMAAEVAAAAVVAALEIAVVHWTRGGGRVPIRTLLEEAFFALRDLR